MRAVFTDPEAGYIAVYRLRGAGFRVEVSGSMAGDIVVTVEPGDRSEEFEALIREGEGTIDAG